MSAPRVSIAIVVRDQAPLLFRCLSALAKLPDEPAFEVLVVDDGSVDETAAVLAAVEGDLHALRNEYPIGFGPACDQAAALARGEHLVLLRPDAVPADGWLEPLVELLDAQPETDAARPRAVDLEGSDDGEAFWPCLALRRSAYERIGGFSGTAVPGRAEKATLLERLTVADVPTALVLMVPEDVLAVPGA
jgi:glycosyltransferase involved in cell wall biosynthesis